MFIAPAHVGMIILKNNHKQAEEKANVIFSILFFPRQFYSIRVSSKTASKTQRKTLSKFLLV